MVAYPISQPADNAAAYTYTQPIRDGIAAANDHQTRITAIEQLPNAKGDVITATADNVLARLPVGTNGQILSANSAQATGLQWIAAPTGGSGGTVTLDTDQTFTGRKTFADVIITQGYYGTRNLQDRLPFNQDVVMDGSTLTAANPGDIVGMQNSVHFQGGFTAEYGYAGVGNPGWLWGANDFITTGTAAGDLAGITNIVSRLCELHIDAPGATTLNTVYAIQADIGLGSTATGTTVGWMASIFGKGPNRAAGTVTNTATLFLTSPDTGTATNEYCIYAEGPTQSYLGGDILMSSDPGQPKTLNAFSGMVRAKTFMAGALADDTGFTAAALVNAKSAGDGDIVSRFAGRGGQTADIMQWTTDTAIKTRVDKFGRLAMRQNTVPADADVATGEVMFYVDTTTNPPTVKFKAKNNSGTVATRTITAT